MPDRYPGAITHVGVTVTDLDHAIRWYREIFGFQVLIGPVDLAGDESHRGHILRDIFGADFQKCRLAHLFGANGVCIELFQFDDPKSEARESNFDYWKTGIFHLAIVEPEIETVVQRIAETGGKRRSAVWTLFPDKPYKLAYCEDPFGNIIELYTHSTEQIWSNR
jgi:catechol 2,3-dioxygenase-like lactoylglutathione lyase family enzyme